MARMRLQRWFVPAAAEFQVETDKIRTCRLKHQGDELVGQLGSLDLVSRRSLLAGGAGLLAAAVGACSSPGPGGTAGPPAASPAARGASPAASGASPTPTRRPPPPPGPLAGIGTWKGAPGASDALADSGARWFYTWAPDPEEITVPEGCEFIPMIQDESHLTDESFELAKSHGDTLLAFNEPELALQANMSVSTALNAWPRFEETGMRLGAPALAGNADNPNSWFSKFMQGVESRGYRVDFVPIHWYLAPALRSPYSLDRAVEDLQGYITRVHEAYGLPIWLSEFSLITWLPTESAAMPPQDQADFLVAAAEMMTPLPYVERWAWFSLTPPPYAPNVATYDDQGALTSVGREFQQLT